MPMPIDIIVLGGTGLIAVLQFITKKQAGLQIFILLASSLMAGIVEVPVANWLGAHGFLHDVNQPAVLVHIALTLIPVAVAWLAVPKDHFRTRQLAGAILFVAVLLAILSGDLASIAPKSIPNLSQYITFIADWEGWIIVAGIAYGIFSLYFVHGHKSKRSKKE
ncbi:MAG TPA: hypothetical protein VGS28_02130 [Candidatus Saccharimonadales bacterium]|nr:hypothetical protein [Candidatus Saccharimonadales bacterium]